MPGPVPAGTLLAVGAPGETVVNVVGVGSGTGSGCGTDEDAGAAPGWH